MTVESTLKVISTGVDLDRDAVDLQMVIYMDEIWIHLDQRSPFISLQGDRQQQR